jgi:uncharacterized membrane protein YbhN (UPF0104 family)
MTDLEAPQRLPGRRAALLLALTVAAIAAFLYFGLPAIAGVDDTWARIRRGDPAWLVVAGVLELLSFASYMVLFRTLFVFDQTRIDWRASYQITMAGVAATRLFAAGGAGGIALTAWALHRSGMRRGEVAARLMTFMVLLYTPFMAALVLGGVGLRSGLLPGSAPFGVTVLPALFGGTVIVLALALSLEPSDLGPRLAAHVRWERLARVTRWLATGPATVGKGVRGALSAVRSARPGLLGAAGWWAFDCAVLWACFHAFGEPPPTAELVVGYFVGMLGNLLPLPGGIGGVEGGMIGSLIAFGVDGGLAIVAVLSYRAFSFWLPTLPGALAYLQLRHTVRRWAVAPPA